jgi:glycosyltransferase involved in cell wall biosynthesis
MLVDSPPRPITVAIPTCNGQRHLATALESILTQQGVAFDLLVCDDRSEDDTLAVVRGVAGDRARIELSSERLGLAGNWNRCARLARTPLVAIFHQDDVMRPGHLERHVRALLQDDAIGLAASAAGVIDENGHPVPESQVERGGLGDQDQVFDAGRLARSMILGNPLRCSAVTLRKEAFETAGGFDPGLRYVVDWEFWLRLSRTWKTAWIAECTVDIRWHAASETSRIRSSRDDLDETALLLDQLFRGDLKGQEGLPEAYGEARLKLGCAYLARGWDGFRAGRMGLARGCLRRALGWRPGLAANPLLWALAAGCLLPAGLAGRLFVRQKEGRMVK